MSMEKVKHVQEAFEKHALENNVRPEDLEKNLLGDCYLDPYVDMRWATWQSAWLGALQWVNNYMDKKHEC